MGRVARFVLLAVLLLGALGAGRAQGGLAYTVQVAALSDPEAAIGQSGTLLRDGFPAYVVRAEGQAGTVFRVRVGAFGDRGSADRYARSMGERAGGTPRPALAEAIPAGILPLAPTAVARVPAEERAVLIPWGEDGVALRLGDGAGPVRYDPLDGGPAFEAWWARPVEGGREEIVPVPLDGGAGEDDPPEVLEALFRQRLRLVADRAGLDEERLAESVRGEPGERRLVLWRRVGPEIEEVRGVLAAGADPGARSEDAWIGEVPPEPEEPLHVLAEEAADGDVGADEDAAETSSLEGDGWSARPDGRWTELRVGDVTWRALVGAPRVAIRDLLVLEVDEGLEIVRLVPR